MLQLEPAIVARLESALPAGWVVKGDATGSGDRKPADGGLAFVSLVGSAPPGARKTAVLISPGWSVLLAARKGAGAPALIDVGIEAVIGALHGWMPGQVAGRMWEPFQLAQVSASPLQDDGITGVELTFTTSGLFTGHH
ncbi:hypothetical protein ACA040_004338 [Xenophilus aerolatus]